MSKIEWCDMTWNPVWGCERGCSYCYARTIAKRFGSSTKEYAEMSAEDQARLLAFRPTFMGSAFCKPFPVTPSRIFVGSMSDIEYWETRWVSGVLQRIRNARKHEFVFLTKRRDLWQNIYGMERNVRKGVTILEGSATLDMPSTPNVLNIEPIMGPVKIASGWDWVIVGAMTGPSAKRCLVRKENVDDIVEQCFDMRIPCFVKHSIRDKYRDEHGRRYPAQKPVLRTI